MQNTIENRPPVLFWIVSAVLFLWGLLSVAIYGALFVQTPEEYARGAETAANQAAYADYVANIPTWALVAASIAALARLFGAAGLLLRRAWALPLYVIALTFFLVALFRGFVLANAGDVMSGSHIMIQVVFVVLSVFSIWFAHWGRSRGLLRQGRRQLS